MVVVSDPQYSVIQGHSVTLQCTVSASPAISSVSWERIISGVATTLTIDGQKFSGAQVQNPDLVINGASTSDEGSYVCTAINSVGIGRSAETSLDVTGSKLNMCRVQLAFTPDPIDTSTFSLVSPLDFQRISENYKILNDGTPLKQWKLTHKIRSVDLSLYSPHHKLRGIVHL